MIQASSVMSLQKECSEPGTCRNSPRYQRSTSTDKTLFQRSRMFVVAPREKMRGPVGAAVPWPPEIRPLRNSFFRAPRHFPCLPAPAEPCLYVFLPDPGSLTSDPCRDSNSNPVLPHPDSNLVSMLLIPAGTVSSPRP